jgi:hypothetical protein
MEQFYIDRQFGSPILIEVENGIVQECQGEFDKFIARMNELYKGKPISFLKTDFEKRMKGAFYNVRSSAILNANDAVVALDSRIRNLGIQMSDSNKSAEQIKQITVYWNDCHVKKSEAEAVLAATRERMKAEHQYDFKF